MPSRFASPAAAAALAATLVVVSQTPAVAAPAVITVTKTTDGVNSHDGLTTLREAVAAANVAGGPVEIALVPGAAHHLSACGSGTDGDLDLTTAHAVTITGQGASIVQHCADGILQHDPPAATSPLTVTGTTLRGGSTRSDDGTAIDSSGSLTLDEVTVIDNGPGAAAVVLHGYGTDEIRHSTIADNAGSSGVVSWSGDLVITDSQVLDNWTGGGLMAKAAGVYADGDVLVDGSVISGNRTAAALLPPRPHDDLIALYALDLRTPGGGVWSDDGSVTLTDSVVADNGGSVVGGVFAGALTMTGSSVAGNIGGGSDIADAGGIWAGTATIADSTIDGNASNFLAGGVRVRTGTIGNSLITGNLGSTGGVHVDNFSGQLAIERSTITGNRAPMGSALMIDRGAVTLEHTTVADNPQLVVYGPYEHRSEITVGNPNLGGAHGVLTARSSLLGSGVEDTPDCLFGTATSTVVSLGTNADGDGSCGLTAGTDLPAVGDPHLGPLADGGGATPTMVPQPWSALRDIVAPGTPGCEVGDVSQNGLSLPQGPGCEIGAAERAAQTGLAGIVTDAGSGEPLAGIEVRIRSAANVYVAATTTGDDGGWFVPGLSPGDYKVLVRDPTGERPSTFNGGASTFGGAAPITVVVDTVAEMDQAMVFTPAITGTITETGTGTPLGGIQVRARTLANTFVGATTTAADGTYDLHLAPGTYKLVFTDPAGNHTTEWYADKPGFAKATAVTHTDATTTANAQLTPITG